jgi:hypothetical protein
MVIRIKDKGNTAVILSTVGYNEKTSDILENQEYMKLPFVELMAVLLHSTSLLSEEVRRQQLTRSSSHILSHTLLSDSRIFFNTLVIMDYVSTNRIPT